MSREVFKCLLFFYEAGWWTPFIILELVLVGPGVDSFRESKRGKAVSLCSYSRYSVVWGKTKPFSSVTHCNFPLQKEKNVCLWCVHCLQCGAQHISMLVISIFLVFFFFFPPLATYPVEIVFTLIERSREQLLCLHDHLISFLEHCHHRIFFILFLPGPRFEAWINKPHM